MITEVIKLIQAEDNAKLSENISIAKGKYQYPRTFKGVWVWFKRQLKDGKGSNNRN